MGEGDFVHEKNDFLLDELDAEVGAGGSRSGAVVRV